MAGVSAFVALLMGLHATQFALQPIVTRDFLAPDADKGALVVICELFKILISLSVWTLSGTWGSALKGWELKNSLITAAVPALIYSTQNLLIQTAYQNMDGVSFNVVNQTKFVFTAVFLYTIYGKRQSATQVVALIMMFAAAVTLTLSTGTTYSCFCCGHYCSCVVVVVVASQLLWWYTPTTATHHDICVG